MTVPTEEDKPMLKNLVHDQVKILLERMDTHPEEFIKQGKWDSFLPPESTMHRGVVMTRFKNFTRLEQYLIRRKYDKLAVMTMRQRAYDGILETLVFKENPTGTITYSAPAHLGIWGNATSTTVNANTLTLGNETLDEETVKHIKAHLETMRKEQQEALHQAAKKLYRTSS